MLGPTYRYVREVTIVLLLCNHRKQPETINIFNNSDYIYLFYDIEYNLIILSRDKLFTPDLYVEHGHLKQSNNKYTSFNYAHSNVDCCLQLLH